MRYISLFSGIEAASVAWHPLGWEPLAFSEIEPFPCQVLKHRYPHVPNLGDVTRFKEWPDFGAVDLIVGGAPCQAFSVAGLRAGLADPRGNLTLTYLAVIAKYQPRWILFENVPGILSVDGGRTFATFLTGLAELGYGFAYRVLDAQYVRVDGYDRAVPQRRRRVFVIGHFGDWRRAAAVLFDGASLRGDSPPRREARQDVVPTISARPTCGGGLGTDLDGGLTVVASTGDIAYCLNAGGMGRQDYGNETMIAHTLRAGGFDAGEDGTGGGTPLVAVTGTLNAVGGHAYSGQTIQDVGAGFLVPTLTTDGGATSARGGDVVTPAWAVRRLTPTECERLMGFPDNFTSVPYRNKPASDGPRYKALGNSMAVNAMRWIGRRIELVEAA